MNKGFPLLRNLGYAGISLLAAVLLSGSVLAQQPEHTSLWEVSSGDQKLYLGGTIHLLKASDYPLPEQFTNAYEEADLLYFETDIQAMSDMSFQAKMLQALTYQDGRTLKSVLNEEAYTALSEYMDSVGLPLAMMQTFKPGMLISTLSVIEMQKMGYTPQGVDAHFSGLASGDGKPQGELESLDTQIEYLATMGEGNESEFVLISLADFEQTEEMMDTMVAAWRTGDNEALATYFVEDMQSKSPEVYQSLLVDRNNSWMPIIQGLFDTEEVELILVGAAHLVGEDGLLAMLAAEGYEIRQL